MRAILVALVMMAAGCAEEQTPVAYPLCSEMNCALVTCSDKGQCLCDGETCVQDAAPPASKCVVESATACSEVGIKGWTEYDCNDSEPDPAGMECIDHDELWSRGIEWISARCCRPAE